MGTPTRLQITLSTEQTAHLLEQASKLAAAETGSDCEPSGYSLEIGITPIMCWAEAIIGNRRVDLGEVGVRFIVEDAQ